MRFADEGTAESLCRQLRSLRISAGLTQREAAASTGVSAPYISQLERGRRKPPSREILGKLAAGYGVHESLLLGMVGQEFETAAGLSLERLDWAFDSMCRDPRFRSGRALRSREFVPDVKAFLLEIYAESTGRRLLTEEEAGSAVLYAKERKHDGSE